MNRIASFSFVLVSSLVLFFSACKNTEKAEDSEEDVATGITSVTDNEQISAQNVFNSIPARADIINLISQDKLEYNPVLIPLS